LTANAVTPDQCKLRLIGSEGVCWCFESFGREEC
jgi:hypothetical protein